MNSWFRLKYSRLDELKHWLAVNEPASVALIDRLFMRPGEAQAWQDRLLCHGDEQAINAVVYANPSGLYLPLGMANATSRFPHKNLPFALVGLDCDVNPCMALFQPARIHWHYRSMYLPNPVSGLPVQKLTNIDFAPRNWQGMQLRLAVPADLQAVFPLQCAYETEEVLSPGMPLHSDATRASLERSLLSRTVLVIEAGNKIVAKVGINACGFRWAQVGGVYTLPAWRNRGLSSELMKFLVQAMLGAGWGLSLFVKNHNEQAMHVYKKLGFTDAGSFSVVYY